MAEWIDLSRLDVDPNLLECIPASVAYENLAFPVMYNHDTLIVAVADPDESRQLVETLRSILNRNVEAVGAPLIDIKFAIWRHYGPPAEPSDEL